MNDCADVAGSDYDDARQSEDRSGAKEGSLEVGSQPPATPPVNEQPGRGNAELQGGRQPGTSLAGQGQAAQRQRQDGWREAAPRMLVGMNRISLSRLTHGFAESKWCMARTGV